MVQISVDKLVNEPIRLLELIQAGEPFVIARKG
jgi:antitoxin (DNA-binding transcriptional repressor) of toxin-antitoxin stability system